MLDRVIILKAIHMHIGPHIGVTSSKLKRGQLYRHQRGGRETFNRTRKIP